MRVEYSATANIAPGQHLSILMFPPGRSQHQPSERSAAVLTGREREVLRLVAGGLSNAEIAARLAVSRHTVVTQIASASAKLGATGRNHAATLAGQLERSA